MENHTLDINKRYKNVSKTWDRDPFSDFCQNIVQDEVDKFLDKREQEFSDKTVDVYGKIGLTGDNGTVYAQSAISGFDSSNSIEMVDHPTNLDKVFDKMEDEKHSLETNDVYDWTKPKPHPLTIGDENTGKEKSTKDYSENFRKLVEETERTNKIKKSLAKGLSEILEDEVEELDEAQIWMRDSLIGIGEHGNITAEPKLDTIEKAPQYNSEVFPEVIVMMEDNFKIIATMCFAKLNSFKYRMRTGLKDVKKIEEDIKKAMNYESRYKVFLEKMKSIFYKDKVLPLIIGDETFEMKVIGNDYKTEIQNIKLYLEKYATETK